MRLGEFSANASVKRRIQRLSFVIERHGAAFECIQDVAQIDAGQPTHGLVGRTRFNTLLRHALRPETRPSSP